MEDHVRLSRGSAHRGRVPDVGHEQVGAVVGEGSLEVFAGPVLEVVDDPDPARAPGEQLIDQMAADEPGTPGDDHGAPLEAGGCGGHAAGTFRVGTIADDGRPVGIEPGHGAVGAQAAGSGLQDRQHAQPGLAVGPRRPALADAGRELRDHLAQGLVVRQRRRPGVAEAVRDRRVPPVGGRGRLVGQVDAPVVDAERLLREEVVPHQRAAGPADDHLADLGGAEPVDVDVGEGAVAERQGEVADAGTSGTERIGPVGGDPRRAQAAGEDEVQDRQVVGRQVPEDVHIGLDQTQVDADRVDEQDVSEGTLGDELADLEHRRGVAVGVVGHQDQPVRPGGLDHLDAVVVVVGQRLLDQHVLAGLQGRQRDGLVRARRGRDGHGVDVVAGQHLLQRVGDVHVLAGDPLGAIQIEVADHAQGPVTARAEVPGQIRSPVARADDGDPEFLVSRHVVVLQSRMCRSGPRDRQVDLDFWSQGRTHVCVSRPLIDVTPARIPTPEPSRQAFGAPICRRS